MTRSVSTAIALVLMTAYVLAQAGLSDAARFKAAQHLEDVEGDLVKAITHYRSVASVTSDRAIAARALIRLAECLHKLGDAEARRVYARILADYGDQNDAVQLARSRLSSQDSKASVLTTQRVLAGSTPWARVSPDGRFVVFNDGSTSNLAIRDLTTNAVRQLTFDGVAEDPDHQYPLGSVFSRSGKQIAYEWYIEGKTYRSVLRVISSSGSPAKHRTIFDNPDVIGVLPTDWSPDEKWIAAVIRRADRTAQIGLIEVESGSLRVLKSVDWSGVGGLRFSADGSHLAYHRPSSEGSFERDVFSIAADGSRERTVAGGPSDDMALEWTHDGRSLLIASDRGGSMGVWRVPLHTQGPPASLELIKSDVGTILSLGLSRDGTLFYNLLPGGMFVSVGEISAANSWTLSNVSQPIQQFRGMNTSPEWSSDGRSLAFWSRREVVVPNTPRPVIGIISMDSGAIREIYPKLSYGGMGRWSPDDRLFIAWGADLKGRSGIVKIDTSTGDAHLVAPQSTCSGVPVWSRTGVSFFCYNFEAERILEINVESGEVRRSLPATGQAVDVSPDGKHLVHFNYNRQAGPPALNIMSLADGSSREVMKFRPPDAKIGNEQTVRFTPDGRHLVLFGTLRGDAGLWLIPLNGEAPRKLEVPQNVSSIAYWRFNPKTDQVAFSASPAARLELWKMQHFLPNAAQSQSVR